MDSQDLITERVKLHEANKGILEKASAEKRTLNTEEQSTFDKQTARMDEIRSHVDRVEASAAQERLLAESRGRQTETVVAPSGVEVGIADFNLALRAWALGGKGKHVTPEMIAAAERCRLDPRDSEVESRALSVGTTTAGGNSVQNELMRGYFEAEKWFGAVRNLSTVYKTETGATLPIPSADDTSNTGEIISEGGAVTTTADPTFAVSNLGAFKYSSKAVIVPVELLQDSTINIGEYLGRRLGERVSRKQNTDFSVGAGTTLPFGLMAKAAAGKTATATNAITLDEIIDLYHSVDKAYRDRPGSGFMMHDGTAARVRKLKDSNNQYLWQMAVQAGMPDLLFGKPVYINNDLDEPTATGKKVMLYGDFGQYVIRDAGGPVFARADELRILNHQVVFLAFQRTDATLPNTAAIKHLVTA